MGVYNGKFTAGSGPVDNSVATGTSVDDGLSRINTWTRNNTTGDVALYTLGAADGGATLNAGSRTAVPSVAIGSVATFGGGQLSGSISEMTLFPTVYTGIQRQAIEGNQGTYYGIAVAPSILTSGTLSALTANFGTASTNTSFTVSGGSLTADITITAPAGFEVSTDPANSFANVMTLTRSGGAVSSTTVYVRLAATDGEGTYSGNIALITSTGATQINVATAASAVINTNPPAITSLALH